MHPAHVFLVVMMVGGLLAAWYAQRARYGPGNFGALVALAVLASAVLAWVIVVVFEIEPPDSGSLDVRSALVQLEVRQIEGHHMALVSG